MKTKLLKCALLSVGCFVTLTEVSAQDFTVQLQGGQTLCFKMESGGAMVTRPGAASGVSYQNLGHLTIPDSVVYDGVSYAVTAIDSNTFAGCAGLNSITIPATVETIGQLAFSQVEGMANTYYTGTLNQWCGIHFSSSSSNPISASGNLVIGGSAITTASFTDEIMQINQFAFVGCTSLTGELVIPSSITRIGKGAFYICDGLTSVVLSAATQVVEEYAFAGCGSLQTVTLPEGVRQIGNYAFMRCDDLESVVIPKTMKRLGRVPFKDCESLASVQYNADSCMAGEVSEGLIYPVFGSGCTSLTSITIGENVKVIPDYVFAFCQHITEVNIPDSVVSIGNAAFQTCSILASVTMGNSVAAIGDSAFGWCGQLWRLILRGAVPPTYGFNSFAGISGSAVVYVPCAAEASYENHAQWGMYDIEGKVLYRIEANSEDEGMGQVEVIGQATCSAPQVTVNASANVGYTFSHWSDGVTDNPRLVTLSQDTSLTAFFAPVNAIENVQNVGGSCLLQGRRLSLDGELDEEVRIYDMEGRVLARLDGRRTYTFRTAGVYLVCFSGGRSSKLVVY